MKKIFVFLLIIATYFYLYMLFGTRVQKSKIFY